MIVYKNTNILVKILKKIDDNNYVIQYGENTITSCSIYELVYLN